MEEDRDDHQDLAPETATDMAAEFGISIHQFRRLSRAHGAGRRVPGYMDRRYTHAEVEALRQSWRLRTRTEPDSDDDRFYTVAAAGELLGVSRQRVDQMIRLWFPEWLDRPEIPKRFSRNEVRALSAKQVRTPKS